MLHNIEKFNLPEIEEKVLKFWKENRIFKKSLKNREGQKPFRFFEGPPTANGRPGMHHVLARAFKDIILRYKTMRGYYAPRRAGWDTHGLPVEIEVERELGIKNKQGIEKFGIAEFNTRAKLSVWKYKNEWEKLTERIGFWLDFDNAYITYDNKYIESLWWILSQIDKRGFLKKLYKVVPWCPRCQTPLSSHELGQPGVYRKTKDPSVFVKFKVKSSKLKIKEYLLVWTTTPWTLPANVAIAVNPGLTYTKYKVGSEYFWSHNPLPNGENKEIEVIEKMSGKKLIGLEYEPLYKNSDYYRVLGADFVSTEEGTGLVHIAPAFGEDDLKVMTDIRYPLSEIPITVDEQGIVKKSIGIGKFIKEADKDIVADLKKRGLIYQCGLIEHEYPFCWRCSAPLIYFIRDSWFILMNKLRDELISVNKKINWIPEHLKEGRFGEWLREIKDWAISRERYWGTPLPIWEHEKNKNSVKDCDRILVINGLDDLDKYAYSQNKYFLVRHAESNHNIDDIIASGPERGNKISKLTKKGVKQAEAVGKKLQNKKIDLIFCSPYFRTKQTAKLIAKLIGAKVIVDKRLAELNVGIFSGRPDKEYKNFFSGPLEEFYKRPPGGENLTDVKKRMLEFIKDIDGRYQNKNIAVVSHGDPLWVLAGAMRFLTNEEICQLDYIQVGSYQEAKLNNRPFNRDGELDLHRPFVDELYLRCPDCGEKMRRIKEVADVWFDSGAMPFAQWHYPFENKDIIDGGSGFPADYIVEGVDQTRGWFYTLLAVSVLLEREAAYRNVVSLGLLLDKHGQKMSKSKGNTIDPWQIIPKYGADVIRWYFYTVNPPGESKRFDEIDLAKTFRKVFSILYNSFIFWKTYGEVEQKPIAILDKWILARLNETILETTESLERYDIGKAAKLIESLIDDFSHWYIRRSRKNVSGKVINLVLGELAKLTAPFIPFFSEALYQSLGGALNKDQESVHLADWPKADKKLIDKELLEEMAEIRRLASLVLAEREKAGIKVRQPLAKLKIKSSKLKVQDKAILDLLKEEVNVKEVILDNKLGGEIELDTKITPELRNEGILRELTRLVQGLRRDAKCQPKDKIVLMMGLPKEALGIVETNESKLKKLVSAKAVIYKKEKFDAELNSKIEEQPVWLAIRKVS